MRLLVTALFTLLPSLIIAAPAPLLEERAGFGVCLSVCGFEPLKCGEGAFAVQDGVCWTCCTK
ncbi:hypothetical protein CC78DRAFT_613753 [Lojkania enalia]|uniref:Uncharacterized protein n=1 Tax=Lojkania enalia TaxID=147567 RepID=A0A9P4KHW0_9PLEO|nr:hypothetical protein CC78DRAFT_613753 [Didymosphaeria enalia]